MSDFILNYEILESIIKDSRALGKQAVEYAEGLDGKVIGVIVNVTGSSSGNLISAYDSISDKINALKQKTDAFYHYAEQISNLLEMAQQVDQEVADTIAIQKENFIDRHKSQRLEHWKEKLLNLLIDVQIFKSLLAVISKMLNGLSHVLKSSKDVIKGWYKTAGEETVGRTGGMADYEKNNLRTFRDLKNSRLNDNVDLKRTIKQWYKNPKGYSAGSNKAHAAEGLSNSDRPLLAYERDLEKIKYSKNPFKTIKYLGKYFWDRFPGLYAHNMEQLAIMGGIDPEWAKIAGDFTSMSVLEGFATITVNGVRAYKNLRTGQIIYDENVVIGSGIGNITKGPKAGSRAVEEGAGASIKSGIDATNSISKSDLLKKFIKVEDKLKVLKDPSGNYAKMAKALGYDNFSIDSWRKGIQSFIVDGLRVEYHFVKNIKDGTVMGEKIFKVINGVREYFNIIP